MANTTKQRFMVSKDGVDLTTFTLYSGNYIFRTEQEWRQISKKIWEFRFSWIKLLQVAQDAGTTSKFITDVTPYSEGALGFSVEQRAELNRTLFPEVFIGYPAAGLVDLDFNKLSIICSNPRRLNDLIYIAQKIKETAESLSPELTKNLNANIKATKFFHLPKNFIIKNELDEMLFSFNFYCPPRIFTKNESDQYFIYTDNINIKINELLNKEQKNKLNNGLDPEIVAKVKNNALYIFGQLAKKGYFEYGLWNVEKIPNLDTFIKIINVITNCYQKHLKPKMDSKAFLPPDKEEIILKGVTLNSKTIPPRTKKVENLFYKEAEQKDIEFFAYDADDNICRIKYQNDKYLKLPFPFEIWVDKTIKTNKAILKSYFNIVSAALDRQLQIFYDYGVDLKTIIDKFIAKKLTIYIYEFFDSKGYFKNDFGGKFHNSIFINDTFINLHSEKYINIVIETIRHEFCHLVSTTDCSIGFRQNINHKFDGINEAFSDILAKINQTDYKTSPTDIIREIAQDFITDIPKALKRYLTGDIAGLIDDLSLSYGVDRDKIQNILYRMDDLFYAQTDCMKYKSGSPEYQRLSKEVEKIKSDLIHLINQVKNKAFFTNTFDDYSKINQKSNNSKKNEDDDGMSDGFAKWSDLFK